MLMIKDYMYIPDITRLDNNPSISNGEAIWALFVVNIDEKAIKMKY